MIRYSINLIVLCFLVACNSASPVLSTITVGPTIAVPIQASPTIAPTPNPTATATLQPFLISLTTYPDGGDELYTCFLGFNRPSFILYEDGDLIVLRDGYKKAILSQPEIGRLMQSIAATRLIERPERVYKGGFNELIVNGVRYFPDYSTSSSDPAQRAWEIIENYQPTEMMQYVPTKLFLAIYGVSDMAFIEAFTHGRTPKFDDWQGTLFSSYGIGWHEVTGADVSSVMDQFENFPDFRLFRDGEKNYIALICADFDWP